MAQVTWCWRRWIAPGDEDAWIARLQAVGCAAWTLTERPDRARILLAVYDSKREAVEALRAHFGGKVRAIRQGEWLRTKATPPTRVGKTLEIHHEKPRGRLGGGQLVIPHGLAFGSGEHATTFMLLRALVREPHQDRVLDLGTGSGVLALAARRLGAGKIVATDFDPDAVRTARQNEALNFAAPLIRWRRADVTRLAATARYDLVLANLFSGILIEAAARISACVADGGQLWMSGILRAQQDEVMAAYRGQGLRLLRTTRRGKWVMLQWRS
jgi:ribosomal protein L11 methyltransferase